MRFFLPPAHPLCTSFTSLSTRWLLTVLFLASASFTGCTGCEDTSQDPDAGPGLDMQSPGDMARDLDERPDTGDPGDLDMGPSDMLDSGRPPRRDMPISEFDFGSPEDMDVPLSLEAIIPPFGPVAGGTLVTLRGSGLEEGTQVLFSGIDVTSSFESVDGVLIGRTPPSTRAGAVSVKLIASDGDVDTLEDGFTYVDTLRIDDLSPTRVPLEGGVEIDLSGRGFGESLAVSVGGREALRVEVINGSLVRFIAPPQEIEGVYDVRVTTPSESRTLEDAITYFERLELRDVRPASGPLMGGNQVEIVGGGFRSGMQIFFGDRAAEVLSVSAQTDRATVIAPAFGTPGRTSIRLVTPRESSLHPNAYLYVDENANPGPQLLDISPRSGSTAGNERVLVTGYDLDDAALNLSLGANASQIIDRQPDRILIETPAATAPGLVDVVLAEGATEVDRLANAYTYLDDFELTALSPGSGPSEGGTQVTITGEGLDRVERVRFGGLLATIVDQSASSLTLLTPAHAAGLVDVEVESDDGLKRLLTDAFLYEESLEIWGVAPGRGSIAGGTYVELRGRGFQGAMDVSFRGVPAPVVRRLDPFNLYVYTPPGAAGEAGVSATRTLTAEDGQPRTQSASAPYPYLYFNPASRFGGASGADVEGSVNVSVFTTQGVPIPSAFVMLSTRPDTRYQGLTDPDGYVTLSGPDVLGAQSVTATAAGFATVTVQSVDAENITVLLNPVSPPSGGGGNGSPPPFGIIRGNLTTPGKLADPTDQSVYDMAIVGTTATSVFGGNPNPGPGSVVLGSGPYEIVTRIGDLAVIALCGVFDENTQVFSPQYMAVERYIVVSDQGQYDVDLACDIPLDQTLLVKLINPSYAPTGPTANRATVSWNFGFEGYYTPPVIAESLESILELTSQPVLRGVIQDVTLEITVGSYTDGFSPSTQTSVSGTQMTSGVLTMPPLLDVPEPVSPMPRGIIENSRISWESSGPYFPDMYILTLRNEMGQPVWTMTLPGTEQEIVLPEFPDFSGIPLTERPEPIVDGPLFLTITAVRIPDFDYNQFTYQDLNTSRWEANAVNRWVVEFP